jgi:hypothetical protein
MEFIRQRKLFASTEGAFIEQELFESGAGIEATATSPDEVQNRSYPNSFGRHQGSGGYEYITALELDRHGQRIGEEAVALLTAPQCPSGVKTLILDASQTALQIHESCGHPTELDRVFGMEAAYAGTSFMTPEKLNHLQYGSPKVTITADAMTPTGLGTFGWDDIEGNRPGAGAAEQRHDARRRLEPDPLDPDDQCQPGVGRFVARADDRGNQGRRVHGDEPQLEHRRQAAQLPVRHPARL